MLYLCLQINDLYLYQNQAYITEDTKMAHFQP
jgi:hypothetical protein